MNLPVLGTSCECNHASFVFLCLIISFGMIFSRFIMTVACNRTSFLFIAEGYSIIDTLHCVYPLDFGRFLRLTIMNCATVNVCVQVFMWTCDFNSPWYTGRSGIAASQSSPVFNFEALPSCFLVPPHCFALAAVMCESSISPHSHQLGLLTFSL